MLSLSCVDERKVKNDWILTIVLTYDIKKIDNYLVCSQYRKNYVEISVGCIQTKNHIGFLHYLKVIAVEKYILKVRDVSPLNLNLKKKN